MSDKDQSHNSNNRYDWLIEKIEERQEFILDKRESDTDQSHLNREWLRVKAAELQFVLDLINKRIVEQS